MKTKFSADTHFSKITSHVIFKESATYVYFEDGNKRRKDEYSMAWFDTYEQAKQHILNRCNSQVEFYAHCMDLELQRLKEIIKL